MNTAFHGVSKIREIAVLALFSMFAALLSPSAQALGLGNIHVTSAYEQPLTATIPIEYPGSQTESEFIASAASQEVHAAFGLSYSSYLTDVRFSVENVNGKPVIHIRSNRSLSDPYLQFIVELKWATGTALRAYTILPELPQIHKKPVDSANTQQNSTATDIPVTGTTDPSLDSTPVAPQSASPQPFEDGAEYQIQSGDSLWLIAARLDSSLGNINRRMDMLIQANPNVFGRDGSRQLVVGELIYAPGTPEPTQTTTSTVDPEVVEAQQPAVAPQPQTANSRPDFLPDLGASDLARLRSRAEGYTIVRLIGESGPQFNIDNSGQAQVVTSGNGSLAGMLAEIRTNLETLSSENAALTARVSELSEALAQAQSTPAEEGGDVAPQTTTTTPAADVSNPASSAVELVLTNPPSTDLGGHQNQSASRINLHSPLVWVPIAIALISVVGIVYLLITHKLRERANRRSDTELTTPDPSSMAKDNGQSSVESPVARKQKPVPSNTNKATEEDTSDTAAKPSTPHEPEQSQPYAGQSGASTNLVDDLASFEIPTEDQNTTQTDTSGSTAPTTTSGDHEAANEPPPKETATSPYAPPIAPPAENNGDTERRAADASDDTSEDEMQSIEFTLDDTLAAPEQATSADENPTAAKTDSAEILDDLVFNLGNEESGGKKEDEWEPRQVTPPSAPDTNIEDYDLSEMLEHGASESTDAEVDTTAIDTEHDSAQDNSADLPAPRSLVETPSAQAAGDSTGQPQETRRKNFVQGAKLTEFLRTRIEKGRLHEEVAESTSPYPIDPKLVIAHIEDIMSTIENNPGESQYAVFYIEIDKMTQYEEESGLIRAEHLAHEIADLLGNNLDSSQSKLIRLKDDTFVSIEHYTEQAELLTRGETLVRAIESKPIRVDEARFFATLSIGIVPISGMFSSPHEYLMWGKRTAAGIRSQSGEEGVGNGAAVYEPDLTSKNWDSDETFASTIRDFINRDQLDIYFQPLISLRGQKAPMFTSKVELNSSIDFSVLPPDFLTRAFASSASQNIDRWAIQTIIAETKRSKTNEQGIAVLLRVSVNSASNESFRQWLGRHIDHAEIDPKRIVILMHENELINNLTQACSFAQWLKKRSIQVGIVNFGESARSEQIASEMEASLVQFDRGLVDLSLSGKDKPGRFQELVSYCSSSEVHTIVEVEATRNIPTLWKLNIDFIYGDYIQKPMPSMDFDFSGVS